MFKILMKRSLRIAAIVILFLCGAICNFARNASTFFVEAPPSVIGIFDRNSRLDMLDYYRSGLATPTSNVLGGKSRVTGERPELVSVNVSDRTRIDLALLKVKGDTIIALIETVMTPVPDSSIRFYRKDWSEIESPASPTTLDFVAKKDRKRLADSTMPVDFITAEYLPERGIFRFTNHSAEYYVPTEIPQILEHADSTITMRFDGKKFIPAR